MSKAKWIMKQYWRVGTIRALSSLGLGMLVLGRYYYGYVPVLRDLGWIGALTLGITLVFIFLGIGWFYDQRARMWSQKTQANAERNPYFYVPNYKNMTMEYPIFYILVRTMRDVAKHIGYDDEKIRSIVQYMDDFFQAKPNKRDIRAVEKAGKVFMEAHPFASSAQKTESGVPIRSRIKLGFETQMLRLTWIQSLTGLVQDVLVFGALYVVVLFPFAPAEIQLFFAVIGISLPLLIVLTLLGWYYDKRLRVWSVDSAVKIERYPYSYVAEPYLYSRIYPFLYAFFTTMREILRVRGISYKEVDDFMEYLRKFWELSVSRTQDMTEAQQMRRSLGALFIQEKGAE
ncbi:MAG: hypothetical protein ACFFEE_06645 [Candidatus Thorarchaeota archaeon]